VRFHSLSRRSILIAASALLCGCHHHIDPVAGSHYERNAGKLRVIVFVHGVYGGAGDTWTSPKTGVSWPGLMKDDARFANSDIYVVNYPTAAKSGNLMSIDDVVGNVMNRLEADDVFSKHNEVVFICHSMGGLVIERLLLRHQDLASKVRFLFFASTPQESAQISELGHIFIGDPQLREMFPGDENSFLEGLDTGWRDAHFTVPIYCVVERAETNNILIVERYSGTHNCRTVTPINENHINIVKPSSREDDSYIAFWNAFRQNPVLRPENASKEWTSHQVVDCNHTNRQTLTASVALDGDLREQVSGAATATLRGGDHIRNQSAQIVSQTGNTAEVFIKFDGESKNTFGHCPGEGYVTLAVTFPVQRFVPVP